jgi:hypothetical protein
MPAFIDLPEDSLFRMSGGDVYRKICPLHSTVIRNGVVKVIGEVNAVRLGDGQLSECGPLVETIRVHRVPKAA